MKKEPGLADLLKSMFGFTWAMSMFGARNLLGLLEPARAAAELDAVTQAVQGQLGEERQGVPRTGSAPSGAVPPAAPDGGLVPAFVNSGTLDTATFVALGEGLTAGAADFSLSVDLQRDAFPAQMARQMRTGFAQAFLQPPGLGNLPGFPPLPVEVPALMQTTVREPFPESPVPLGNLAVPGFRLADALHLRPTPPVVHPADARQTGANLILGLPALLETGSGPHPTQLERALERRPTLALIALGYTEAIEAALAGEPDRLPTATSLRRDCERLLTPLRAAGSEVLVLNIPDPFDTACLSTLEAAARVVKAAAPFLVQAWGLRTDDRITVRGLIEMGFQLLSQGLHPLPEWAVVHGDAASRVRDRLQQLNAELADIAHQHGAPVADLHTLWRTVRAQGATAGSKHLTADFLGGFYSLNGYYPGKTGHALIANLALQVLNQTYGAAFPLIDLADVAATDPVTLYQPAGGPDLPVGQMPPPPAPAPALVTASGPAASSDRPVERTAAVRRAPGEWPAPPPPGPPLPLRLPPGLELVLPLNRERSYYGDALRAVDCVRPEEAQWGSCGGVLFGGLCLLDSHLSGQLHIRFSPPERNRSRFELSFGAGLKGDDGTLAAPWHYKLPAQQNRVGDAPGLTSSGTVDLETGEVTDLDVSATFLNTALLALIRVNPAFPQVPIRFPGEHGTSAGSAWAKFEQRADGRIDFELFGNTFLPLGGELGGNVVRFPLPFAGGTLQFASIPARGTALHPHLHLSTRDPEPSAPPEDLPEIPTNTVREYTFFTHDSAFGDAFNLQGPFLGGTTTGRSQLTGRLHVQFGERAGSSVPIYVSAMIPGGYLAPFPASPLSQAFPGRLSPGPLGFNELLRFPLKTYYLDDVFLLSDPFNLSVAAVDLRTGRTISDQLHRAFIGQDLFFALVRVEPRTPQESFQFSGPAIFQKAPQGQTVYRFAGQTHIPYPPGFLFPNPNLATGFPAGPGSALDPFFWIQALEGGSASAGYVKRGGASDVLASNGDRFSYRYAIPADPARQPAVFDYDNSSQQGAFRLRGLTWVHFSNALISRPRRGEFDTVTFAGFGIWSKDGGEFLRAATVQISTAAGAPYVGIQIEGGAISNVNTKPLTLAEARP